MKISVVIPVYGCRAALNELYSRLVNTLQLITNDYEIILVNDSCPQNSWEVIENICEKDIHVIGLELSRNFGQMKAILAGLDHCCGDWIVVMDCDLQDRPEEIVNLYNKAMEGYDVVFARRKKRRDSRLKTLAANIFYKTYEFATDGNYDSAVCNFSIAKKIVIDNYCSMREEHRGYVMYIKWLGFKQATIDVERNERYEGKSSYDFKRKVQMAMELLTSQSDKVLKYAVGFGFFISFISVIVLLVLVIRYFTVNITPGWTSIVASNFLLGGLIIMTIGIVGIYVGNIFMQTKDRPLYVVRQILNDKQE